jgi:hypothetical protein
MMVVCCTCDSRCPDGGDPEAHEPLPDNYIGGCMGCSCPRFQMEADQ